MDKDLLKSLVNISVSSAYLLNCCDLLRLVSKGLVESSECENIGFSNQEAADIYSISFELNEIKDKIVSIAVKMREDVESNFKK